MTGCGYQGKIFIAVGGNSFEQVKVMQYTYDGEFKFEQTIAIEEYNGWVTSMTAD
jgi:hypothetical protein